MARYPGAVWKPITASKGRDPLEVYNRMTVHVAASEAASLHGYFNVSGRADSHFYVLKNGTVEQYVDTAMQAFADLEGNDATISVETQGGAYNADTERFTEAQIVALAKLFAWVHKTHGVQLKLATSSAVGDESRGLAWHRLGVPHRGVYSENGYIVKRLTSVQPGYLQSARHMWWSTVQGKACPGTAKIGQIVRILEETMRILSTGILSPEEEDTMAAEDVTKILRKLDDLSDRIQRLEEKGVKDTFLRARTGGTNAKNEDGTRKDPTISDDLESLKDHLGVLEKKLDALAGGAETVSVDPATIYNIVYKEAEKATNELQKRTIVLRPSGE